VLRSALDNSDQNASGASNFLNNINTKSNSNTKDKGNEEKEKEEEKEEEEEEENFGKVVQAEALQHLDPLFTSDKTLQTVLKNSKLTLIFVSKNNFYFEIEIFVQFQTLLIMRASIQKGCPCCADPRSETQHQHPRCPDLYPTARVQEKNRNHKRAY
jgi:hypothetical protein